jgi:MtN3 and saliva related transmembrane protein
MLVLFRYFANQILHLNTQITMTQLLGLTAGLLTTIAFLPQVIKTWKMRSAKDLSLSTFSLFFVGVALWLVYGLMSHDLPIILTNLFTLILAGILLFFKLKFK